jgi:hypothetical protein
VPLRFCAVWNGNDDAGYDPAPQEGPDVSETEFKAILDSIKIELKGDRESAMTTNFPARKRLFLGVDG